jgi:plastocyanin
MSRVLVTFAIVLVAGASLVGAPQVIKQKGRLYSPGKLTVKSGAVLVFQNDDNVTHHVYSATKGHEFKLETVPPGEKANHTFVKRGRVDVRCGLHPGMRLVVTVE